MSATFTMPNAARRRRLVARLVAWYSDHARDLPWRRTSDPYAIWISESMLQQTRVEAVIDYWTRFLERFPTIEGLANAQEDDVLTQWSGLGYYRRARSLHAAAKAVVADHGGRMPSDGASLRALPGIGPYTVGAIRSIAFDQPAALVDGNVERVFARLFDLDLDAAALKRQSWELAESLVPEQSPGAWNQALMELGATVCTPRSPRCEDCPVARSCAARSAGTIADRPRPKVKLPPLEVALELAWASDGDRILLVQRPTGGRMAEMWELPTREIENAAGVLSGLFPAEFAGPLELDEALTNVRHSITKHRIRAVLRRVTGVPKRLDFGRLVAPDELAEMPLTGMTRKVLGKLGS